MRSMDFIGDRVIPGALEYEGCTEAAKQLWEAWTPGGFVGRCKRGSSVMYLRNAYVKRQ